MVHAQRISMAVTVHFIKTSRLKFRVCERGLNAALPKVRLPNGNSTKSFAKIVVDLRKKKSFAMRPATSQLVKKQSAHRQVKMKKTFATLRLRHPEDIAIDETYEGRKKKPFTIVTD